ncbi:MAG: matrixin family metalloprotease, partial [Acidobacteriota bacterium]
MKTISRLAILLIVALLVPATLAADATHNHDHDHGHDHDHHAHVASHVDGEQLVPIACFAPGSDQSLVDNAHRRFHDSRLRHSLDGMVDRYQFSDSARWSATATDGSGLGQGDITTITWSIVPDGTSIFGYNGEPTAPSNLRAWLNGIYGSESVWLPLFQSVFDRWEELTGMNYVYEPNDDGSAWTSTTIASGQLGVRGDVRISGHFIDGNSNVLAYNFFPDFGDMVIDTADNFYNTTSGNSLRLRNVLSHEHGHGMGLNHVCPVNQTKLMEPFASTAFDGPQFDDILAINRGYGDNFENNDTPGTAASLGSIPFGTGVTLGNSTAVGSANVVAIDDNSDTDVYAFTVSGAGTVDVTVSPIGATYLNGPQNANGSCSAGTTYNANDNQNLSFEILGTNGSTVLASVNNTGAGSAESVSGVNLASAGTYFVEISGPSNDVQRYQLDVDVDAGAANTAPTVNISNPSNGASFTQGTSVSFSGSASDAEDGSLTGSLAWSSSLDGSIGSGGSFSTSSLSVGSHTITASVTDSGGLSGNDSISLTITSGGGGGCVDCIDWSTTTTVSFATQDASSNVTVEDGGDTLFLQQNTWRRTTQTYAVTANTVVEFDFLSTSQGEIHGIGLDEDNNLSSNRIFKVHGTQNYGITDFDNYVSGWTTYQIPVGQYYTGSSFFLVLVNDKDAGAL